MPKTSKQPTIRHIPLTQARASLGTIVNDVNRKNGYVVVERGGLPVAAIMDYDEFADYLSARGLPAADSEAEKVEGSSSRGRRPSKAT